jgi:hypothetical protein
MAVLRPRCMKRTVLHLHHSRPLTSVKKKQLNATQVYVAHCILIIYT